MPSWLRGLSSPRRGRLLVTVVLLALLVGGAAAEIANGTPLKQAQTKAAHTIRHVTVVTSATLDPLNARVMTGLGLPERRYGRGWLPYRGGIKDLVSSDGGAHWKAFPLGGSIQDIWGVLAGGETLIRFTTGGQPQYSSDLGQTWIDASLSGGLAADMFDDQIQIIVPDPSNPLFAATCIYGDHLAVTRDGGRSWEKVPSFTGRCITRAESGPEIAIQGGSPSVIYAAWGARRLAWSSDGGATWQQRTLPFPIAVPSYQSGMPISADRYFPFITFSPVNPRIAFIVGGRQSIDRLYRTANGGQTWKHVSFPKPYATWGNLVAFAGGKTVVAIAQGPSTKRAKGPGYLMVSRDNGAHWRRLISPPAVSIEDRANDWFDEGCTEHTLYPDPKGGVILMEAASCDGLPRPQTVFWKWRPGSGWKKVVAAVRSG